MAYDYKRSEQLHIMEVCENRLVADTQIEYGYFDKDFYYAAFSDEKLGEVNIILNPENNGEIYIHPYKGDENKDYSADISGLTQWWNFFKKHINHEQK